ncbi:OstA family protein [Gluconacetobacter diazotrophicus PA1 5]|uniref:LptA/OstA family protein n=1 Tax=Gluconacetobacter diazotrophicus TaxID=33996 RepID=UPI000173D9AE|nr:OstA family protein [Gluconacetobacter diazotrophicus PA1 5]TWB08109.1 lipopolysaccharide export system protein LptA [Gluconacetobacter diazotrophicus]
MTAFPKVATALLLGGVAACVAPMGARGQALDLSHGGQITVTAAGGFDWDQKSQTVTAYDQAQAVRGNVTVTGDRLIAFYRKKAAAGAAQGGAPNNGAAAPASPPPAAQAPAPQAPATQSTGNGTDSGSNEVYRLNAIGHVHIFTDTDQAWGDKAIYDIDQSVMIMTGKAMKMVTPQDVLTARDSMEYYSQTRISIGRGNATVTTNDGRQIRADVLVGYSAPAQPATQSPAQPPPSPPPGTQPGAAPGTGKDPLTSSGKLEKVNAFGHVFVRTQTETVTGDRGVYVPDTGIARIVGNVHITRGQNQINGAAAIVNMHTGIATMTERAGSRVSGLIVPNEANSSPGGARPTQAGTKPGPAGKTP